MGLLTSSVGKGGTNHTWDVVLVKHLLTEVPDDLLFDAAEHVSNGALIVETLMPDGKVGEALIRHIERFQKRVLKFARPDGRVDPGKRTIGALIEQFEASGAVIPLTDLQWQGQLNPNAALTVYGPLRLEGRYPPGTIVGGLDGRRLILAATAADVIFTLLDRSGPGSGLLELNPLRGHVGWVYKQRISPFVAEMDSAFWKRLYDVHRPIVPLLESEVMFLAAFVAAASGTGLLFGAVSLTQSVMANYQKIAHWNAIIRILAEARLDLKRYAPTLYDRIFDVVLMHYIRSIRPRDLAKLAGTLLGTLGREALIGRVNLLWLVAGLVTQVVGILVGGIGNAVDRAGAFWNSGLERLYAEFRKLGVSVTPAERARIFQEFRQNGREILGVATKLERALKVHLQKL